MAASSRCKVFDGDFEANGRYSGAVDFRIDLSVTRCDGVSFGPLTGYIGAGLANFLCREVCLVGVALNQVRRNRRSPSFSYIAGNTRHSYVLANVVAELLMDIALLRVSILVSTIVEGVMMICSY